MAVGSILRMSVLGVYQDQNIVNTIHVKVIEQQCDEVDLATKVAGTFIDVETYWLAVHNQYYQYKGTVVVGTAGSSTIPGYYPRDLPGVVAQDPLLSSIARVITLYGAADNAKIRGRLMLSGASQGDIDETDGRVNISMGLNTLAALMKQAWTNVQFVTVVPVIYTKSTQLAREVIKAVPRPTPGVIRSRRIRNFMVG